jgi:hypothetical protein
MRQNNTEKKGRSYRFFITKLQRSNQSGFTLLLAALAASIALSLGSAIFSITTKEIQLSSIGRDSQFAFYAADTAAECALYWDIRFNYFATSTPPDPQDQYVCAGYGGQRPSAVPLYDDLSIRAQWLLRQCNGPQMRRPHRCQWFLHTCKPSCGPYGHPCRRF